MTEAQIASALDQAIKNTELWKVYKLLFDINVTSQNKDVKYMRALVTGAGPLQDGDKRYKNIKDDSDA